MPKIKIGDKYFIGFEEEDKKNNFYSRSMQKLYKPMFDVFGYDFDYLTITNKLSIIFELMRFKDIPKENIIIEV